MVNHHHHVHDACVNITSHGYTDVPTPEQSTTSNDNDDDNGGVLTKITPPRMGDQTTPSSGNNNPPSTQGGEVDGDGGGGESNNQEALPPPINAPAKQQAPTPKRITNDNNNNHVNGDDSNEVTPPRGGDQTTPSGNNNPTSTQDGEDGAAGGGENTSQEPPIPYTEGGSAYIDVYTALEERIAILEKVMNTPDAYKLVVSFGAFGGNLSVRMPDNGKTIIILGNMQWIAPSGHRKILPKSGGQAMMISAFTSREYGWGMDLSDNELKKINEKREGEDYFDKDAALEVHETTKKKPLTLSPFVRKFEFGGTNGYWNGSHTAMQVEDIMDCLKVIFEDKYEFVFLFDHSSRHAKKRVDGLDVSKMNKSWGGKHVLRSSKIERKEGYLGEYWDPNDPRMVKIGEEQALMWNRANEVARGPFELDSDEELREASRHDRHVPIPEEDQKEVPKTKAELVKDLMATDYGQQQEGETSLKKKLLKNLKDAAEGLGIATKKKPAHKVVYGFEGKCKGLLQILWERGYINLAMIERYRKKTVDEDGNLIPEFSLVHLMENCTDFYNEECQLQFVCRNVGAQAIIL